MKISDAMSHIDDELIAEAICEPTAKHSAPWLRWVAVAACLVLLAGTITIAATTDLGTQLIQTFTEKGELSILSFNAGGNLSVIATADILRGKVGRNHRMPACRQTAVHQLVKGRLHKLGGHFRSQIVKDQQITFIAGDV